MSSFMSCLGGFVKPQYSKLCPDLAWGYRPTSGAQSSILLRSASTAQGPGSFGQRSHQFNVSLAGPRISHDLDEVSWELNKDQVVFAQNHVRSGKGKRWLVPAGSDSHTDLPEMWKPKKTPRGPSCVQMNQYSGSLPLPVPNTLLCLSPLR